MAVKIGTVLVQKLQQSIKVFQRSKKSKNKQMHWFHINIHNHRTNAANQEQELEPSKTLNEFRNKSLKKRKG